MMCLKKILFRFYHIVFFMIAMQSYSQELPPIEIFTPQSYGADNQNWAISQSQNQTIYIANNKGLLEYNGARWNLYSSPKQAIIRSVTVIDEKIFTGSYMDFGFWERDAFGKLNYTSLIPKLQDSLQQDEEFWNIIALEGFILFQSLDRIYIYNQVSQNFRIINPDSRITKMYKTNDVIYFQKSNHGLYKIENGISVLVSDDKILMQNEIVNVFQENENLLIQTRENGFYILNDNTLISWNRTSTDLLSNISVYNSIRLKNGNFILGTISNGIIMLDAGGEFMFRMSQKDGMSNNTVLSLFQDLSGNIWLGLDNGVNTLNLNSPYRVYKDNQGYLGTIYAVEKTKKHLYLGTNQGLFYRPINSVEQFSLVKGTKGQVWSLTTINGTLFCGHDKGTFQIEGDVALQIFKDQGTWQIKQLPGEQNILIQGNYKGFHILEQNNDGSWKLRNRVEGFDISSRYFEFIDETNLLVSHEYKGVYKLKLNDDYTAVKHYNKMSISQGTGSSLTSYKGDVIYMYEEGVFKYNAIKNSFEKDSLLNGFFDKENYVSGKLINDESKNRLWGFFKNQVVYLEPGSLTNTPKINSIDLPSNLRKNKLGFENILNIEDDIYLLGTTEGYLTIDLNRFTNRTYNIVLNNVEVNKLQNNKILAKLDEALDLKNNQNDLYFSYSVPDFDKLSPSFYQYRLAGVYDNWSKWSQTSDVLFENLPHGNYTFEVRAKVGNIITENIATFSFSIEKPWYLKPLAIIAYILLFIIVTATIQFLNTRYYKKQRKKLLDAKEREIEFKELENQKRLMAFKNENLKQDIENKNRELGLSTMNLIRKNEFLNSLKKELNSIEKSQELSKVIKIIDKSINNTEDWKSFEEAFNNADKNFLKKIKRLHPTLTPNDLKLCTYLRLNLSSKEVAPLLNISHRSVEVKRYRLRKKMELAHETSLTNYILEI